MQPANIQRVRWTRAALGVDNADDGSFVIVKAERLGPSVRFQSMTADAARAEIARAGTRVAAVVPVRDTVLRRVGTPLSSRSKAMRVLPSVLDVQLPFPIEECESRFYDLRLTADGTFDALAVAARHSDLSRRIASLNQAGLDPVTLDHEALALWSRSLKEIPAGDAEELRILVSLHQSHSIVVVGQGRRMLGGHHVRGTGSAAILRVLAPYRRSDVPAHARWCWTGPAADKESVAGLFDAMQTAWPGTSVMHEDPATFLARAVAAREVSTDDLACNLRDGPVVHPAQRSRQMRRSTFAACVTLACGVAMVAASLAAGWIGAKREAELTREVARLTDRLAGYPVAARGIKGENALKIARTAVDARIETLKPFRRQLVDSPATVLPAVLESARRHGLQIETLTLTPRKLTIAGTARVWQSCDDLVMQLEKRGMKTRLERRDARDDLRIPFALAAETPDG